MRIAYFNVMRTDPNRVRAVAPEHAVYWHDVDPPAYLGGPMADRSGGLITFDATSIEEAEQLVAGDPFVRADLPFGAWKATSAPLPGWRRDLRRCVSPGSPNGI